MMSNVKALAKLLNDYCTDHTGSIEDIFYDYKDDEDLEYNIYCGDNIHMTAIETKIDELGFESSHTDTGLGHFIVNITMATLADKNAFLESLRQYGFRPNGG